MDRPSGAYIQDPKTGEITPDLSDEAMKNRQLAADQPKQPGEKQDETDKPDKRQRR
jgi:hypothetical protein